MLDMKNNTKSKIIITMNNLDHADKLFQALKLFKQHFSKGGDIAIRVDDDGNEIYIGHDVIINDVEHIIFEK